MLKIQIKKITEEEIEKEQIKNWGIWSKEKSKFDWYYDMEEHCYIIEGEVIVKTDWEEVKIKAGDYVIFPKGLKCVWDIKKDIKKYYNFK